VNDPEGDNVFCLWDWGDGTESGWLGPYASGAEICVTHAWSNEGSFSIRVKVKDEYGAESEWSETFSIIIDGAAPFLEFIKPKPNFLYMWDKHVCRFFGTLVVGEITVEVYAVDNCSGISHVDIYLDDVLKATDYTDENNIYSWLWVERGNFFPYLLKVIAYDLVGNSVSKQIRVWKIL
jgi:hypothetical protein